MKRILLFIIGCIIFTSTISSVHADTIDPDLQSLLVAEHWINCLSPLKNDIFPRLEDADPSIIQYCTVSSSKQCNAEEFKNIVCTNLNVTKKVLGVNLGQLNCQDDCERWGTNGDYLIKLFDQKVRPNLPTSTPTPTPTPAGHSINYCTELSEGVSPRCNDTSELATIQGCDAVGLSKIISEIPSNNSFWTCSQTIDTSLSNKEKADLLTNCAISQYETISDSWGAGALEPCSGNWMMKQNIDGDFTNEVETDNHLARDNFIKLLLNNTISAGLIDQIPDEYTLITPTPAPDDDDILNQFQNRNDDKRGTYGNACWIKPIELPVWKIPSVVPNVFEIRDTINNLIANVTQTFEGMMGKPLVSLRGGTLCGDGSVAAMYQNGTFVSDVNVATSISKAILVGWDEGDWSEYDSNYSNTTCKCVGAEEIIPQQLSAKNGTQGTKELAQVQGVAIASTTETVRLIPNVCSDQVDNNARAQCIINMCNNINSITALPNKPGEITKCKACLTANQSFITDFGSDACMTKTSANLCRPLQNGESNEELFKCVQCINKDNGVWTAIGCIYSDLQRTINEQLFSILIGIAGTSVLLCIIFAAIRMQVSAGNPEKVKAAQDMATSCITGLVMIIFSIVILRIIGVDILRLPSFLP